MSIDNLLKYIIDSSSKMAMKHLNFGLKMSGNNWVEIVLGNSIDCAAEFHDIEVTEMLASDAARCNLIDYVDWAVNSCGL
jgi:hypothetical protein